MVIGRTRVNFKGSENLELVVVLAHGASRKKFH